MKIQSMSSAPMTLPVRQFGEVTGKSAFRGTLGAASDQFQIRFGAKLDVPYPTTIEGSRWDNSWVQLNQANLRRELVVALDEIMTTTGEAYAKDPDRVKDNKRTEAFTTLIDVKFHPESLKDTSQAGMRDASTLAQVAYAYTVNIPAKPEKNRPEMNIGNMVIASEAHDYETQAPLASAKATFVAVDADSVKAGKNQTVAVRELAISTEGDKKLNTAARQWEEGLRNFYKTVTQGLESSSHPDLRAVPESDTRSVTTNMYVKTDMLNKKKTGHGGVTTAMAVDHMRALSGRFLNAQGFDGDKRQVTDLTASFARPYLETDALQFDTTIDHVDKQGNIYMSSRISKHDTQGGQVSGPVFIVHARFRPDSGKCLTGANWLKRFGSKPAVPVLPEPQDEAARARREQAIAWAALRDH